jgi:N-acetylglucosaminyldiphosphoundecaprenol N-acetyl-beta-D-mannosaminyltransferase
MLLADGMSVVYASRLLGRRLPERVAGIDLMHAILDQGRHRGTRFYCLGATGEVLERAIERMKAEHRGVVIAGSHHGYFGPDEEGQIVEDIRRARADVVFVAMSSPKKEQFLARWLDRMGVPVCHGVGGSFDVLAGKVKRAPRLWQRLGMEWLYRVLQEPRRMWRRYAETNTLFCWMVLTELFRRGTSRT